MIPIPHAVALLLLAVLFLSAVVRRQERSIAHLPSPSPGSWLVGNLPDLFRPKNVGDAEFAWIKKFGTAMKIKGAFGSDVLFIVDPKALHYVLNTSGCNFPKPWQSTATTRLTAGKGLVWARGEQHARHRKIMNPAFSYSTLKEFLPLFRQTAQRTVAKWKDMVAESGSTCVIDTPTWIARSTLDAMGAAAFDYDFGALDDSGNNELLNVYRNLFARTFFKRSDYTFAFEALWGYIPEWLLVVLHRLPTKQLERFRNYMKVARRVAKSIVDRQIKLHAAGKEGGKDVMSILVRANLSEDPKRKLGEDEVLAQLTTLMLAGHETTASTITWALYELSKRPEFQNEIRKEIKATRALAAQRGDDELSVTDLDSMKSLLALVKETLRYHPIVPFLRRAAERNDVIPLAVPQTSETGETITAIPVGRGQRIIISIAAYNRLQTIWGEDADTWRPERFLQDGENTQKPTLGVFANIATFGSGFRACIGWKFALIQIQAILIELLDNFEFSPPPGEVEIIRAATGTMSPMIKGLSPARTALPLTIAPVT